MLIINQTTSLHNLLRSCMYTRSLVMGTYLHSEVLLNTLSHTPHNVQSVIPVFKRCAFPFSSRLQGTVYGLLDLLLPGKVKLGHHPLVIIGLQQGGDTGRLCCKVSCNIHETYAQLVPRFPRPDLLASDDAWNVFCLALQFRQCLKKGRKGHYDKLRGP